MRPRIAVISQQYGTLGGGEIFAREVTERIARTGKFDMHVFSRKWESECREVTFHRVPMWGVPRQLIPTAFAWMASRMARRMGFDLVHAQSRVADADVFSVHWCPHAFWTRDILKRKPRWSDRLRMRLDEGMLRGAANRVYMPVSAFQQQIFQSEYGALPGEWRVVHPGVHLEAFAPEVLQPLRAPTRAALGLPADAMVILFVGMNFESKGLETIIRAVGLLKSRHPAGRAQVLVVGKGDESRFRRIAVEAGCADAITFAGAHRDGLSRFHAAADVFAMPASFETFSMATLEAMAAGLPVVISDRMGVRDIVRNGVNGFVTDSIRPTEACASRLGELLDQQRRVSLGQAARNTVAEHGWDHVAKAVMDTYQRLLNR
ncbi:MAG: glycosyltransferase family 1 protein [Planctomycetes bacterium]|nr:glycosyltransferase family 1 protein [Planctomycetota bacterium]